MNNHYNTEQNISYLSSSKNEPVAYSIAAGLATIAAVAILAMLISML